MNKQISANKGGLSFLDTLALIRIKECERFGGEIIRFPKIFQKICSTYSIKKKDAWILLYYLRDLQLIEIISFQGVRLKNG